MKKILPIIATLILLLLFSNCTNSNDISGTWNCKNDPNSRKSGILFTKINSNSYTLTMPWNGGTKDLTAVVQEDGTLKVSGDIFVTIVVDKNSDELVISHQYFCDRYVKAPK